MQKTKRILAVKIKRMIDENPDTSNLGEYSDKRTSKFSIDRAHRIDCKSPLNCDCIGDDWNRHEYRYFNPSFNYVDKNGEPLPDETPENVQKYTREDYERMESLNRGDWCYIGIRAEADVILQPRVYSGVIQNITSGGLWGIESDSEKSYFADVAKGELASLREQLLAAGFSHRAISQAFKSIQEVSE